MKILNRMSKIRAGGLYFLDCVISIIYFVLYTIIFLSTGFFFIDFDLIYRFIVLFVQQLLLRLTALVGNIVRQFGIIMLFNVTNSVQAEIIMSSTSETRMGFHAPVKKLFRRICN